MVFVFGVPEMVKTSTKHVGQRSKRADVAAQIAAVSGVVAVGFDHHGHRVPAHVSTQTLFNFDVAGATGFFVGLDAVHIAGGGRKRQINAVLAGFFEQLFQQKMRTLRAFFVDHGGQGVHPFTGFLTVQVTARLLWCCRCHVCLLKWML